MQSRTIIAGSVAIAICLISGALVFVARQDGGEVKRVVRRQPSEAESPTERPGGGPQGIIKTCGEEVGVGPETSCDFGMQVWHEEQSSGSASTITVKDPASGDGVSLECEGGGASASIVCAGDGTTVYLAAP